MDSPVHEASRVLAGSGKGSHPKSVPISLSLSLSPTRGTPDFCSVLNLPKDSSSQDIRRAYKDLVRKWHPDKHPPSSKLEAEARFKSITQAYEALHDPPDQYRSTSGTVYNDDQRAGTAGGWSINRKDSSWARSAPSSPGRRDRSDEPRMPKTPGRDLKNVYYSSSRFATQRRKPPAVEKKLECTLEELCRGCNKDIRFSRDVVDINGLVVQKQETQTIRVKPGWKKGTKIMFEGMGDERPGCLPADVVFSVAEKEHPIFKRAGNDLVLKVEIPLVNALTGWSFSFRLLTGEKMSCSFQDEVLYPGFEKIIKGHGMPVTGEKGARGDLSIKFNIVFPKKLSKEQRASIREVLMGST